MSARTLLEREPPLTTVYNFNAGPAILPADVLAVAQSELRDYQGCGMSVLEMSHRSSEYEHINAQAQERFLSLLGLEAQDGYRVLFLQGGASLQFAMLPLNFLPAGRVADYILSGSWSEKARDEAAIIGDVHVAATTVAENYRCIPRQEELELSSDPAYVHLTSNNTIYGTQWSAWPEVGTRALVADMSSDIFSRPLDVRRFSLIYAGAQKNLGPSGVTVVLVRDAWLADAAQTKGVPAILRYSTHLKASSLYNTPPTFGVYLLNLTLGWIADAGGLSAMATRNQEKASIVYAAIDGSGGFYRGHAEVTSRSLMNATFRLPTADLEKAFVKEATAQGMIGLAGHRSVGGIRASLYNALPAAACHILADFMGDFGRRNG